MGELLASQCHVEADIVMGVPDSGVPAAEGFAKRSGIPFGYGLVKNRYIGRTFIAPDQDLRAASVRRKLNPLRENIEGQRLVVVDDSIVRGTTTRALVAMLRDAGALRGAPADLLAAVHVALLLRDRHAEPRRAARGEPLDRGDARLHRVATRWSSSRSRTCARRSGSTESAATPA